MNHLKVPVEMAQFALRTRNVSKVQAYLAAQFIYSGKAELSDKPAQKLADVIGVKERTIYRHFNWLLNRNWIGKDTARGYLFFRGFARVHSLENWQFARAAIMHKKDLKEIKAFLAGVVFASLAETGKGQQTERLTRRSEPPVALISLSVIAQTLDVSQSTAYRLRKLADDKSYINNEQNLVQITNWNPNDLKHLKANDLHQIPVELLGYADKKIVPIDRIRYKKNKLFLQEPNLIKPLLHLKSRKGLSKYRQGIA